jgi:hypothetical protein
MNDPYDKPPRHVAPALRKHPRPTREVGRTLLIGYVKQLASMPFCIDVQGRKAKCSCLHANLHCDTGDSPWLPLIAGYLYDFLMTDAKLRAERLVESVKILHAHGQNVHFPMPSWGTPDGSTNLTVCKHSYFRMLDVRKDKFRSLLKQARTNVVVRNKLAGRKGNSSLKEDMASSLEDFFDEMQALAAPRATRFIRMETGTDVRDADSDLLELPSHWSGRRLYGKWCESRGQKMTLKNHKSAIELKPIEDFVGQVQECCVLSTFQNFWKKQYPNLVLVKAREDICTDCFILSHTFRYYSTRNRMDEGEEVNGYENQEQALEMAKVHVDRAKAQREYFNKISTEDGDVLVMDYMQNLGLPHLGAEQSGNTYYYSPLNVFGFGIVNMKTKFLHCLVYDEGEGKKGGNNVASMIMFYLEHQKMLEIGDEGKPKTRDSLKIVMDNCSGQNKVS